MLIWLINKSMEDEYVDWETKVGIYKTELTQELYDILDYWLQFTIDSDRGGFYGRLGNDNHIFKDAPKGSVLNSRILWAFSAAFNQTKKRKFLKAATRAYYYLATNFIDKKYGGVFWSVDCNGKPFETRKQIYALSFAIYGLCEYHLASGNSEALEQAKKLYALIIDKSYDEVYGGYIEAFSEDWSEIKDLRLSAKDANEKKSMNTHLHILEGFANLYKVWPDKVLKSRIEELIEFFLEHIIDQRSNHLILFFDEMWNPKSETISFGHDIEAAWLILEAAEITENHILTEKVRDFSIHIANAASEGLDKDGGLWYEFDKKNDQLTREKHSWPQAESMIGFFNAFQLTEDFSFLEKSFKSWQFIKEHIKDVAHGEWFWGVKEDYSLMDEDKVGFWKCPYHNTRACIEVIKRINLYWNGTI
jgi:cellobiose epimerase